MSIARFLILSLLTLSLLAPAAAQERDALASLNPAESLGAIDTSRSLVFVGFISLSHSSDLVEEGDALLGWRAEGRAAMRLSENLCAWGGAAYADGKRENVLWSESADYDEIAPMAVADTLGGDKDYEEYLFLAGFAWQGARAAVGLQVDYSSKSEARTRDPRPKAESVAARVRIGGRLKVSDGLGIGLYGLLRKYAQDLDIKFMNVYGSATTIYQLTGLGADYSRFSASHDEYSYEGRAAGGGLTFTSPLLSAVAEFSRRHTEKILPDAYNIVINETYENALHLALFRSSRLGLWKTSLSLAADIKSLELSSLLYGSGDKSYRQIATRKPYTRDVRTVGLLASMGRPDLHHLTLNFDANFWTNEQVNTEVERSVEVRTLCLRVGASAVNAWRRVSLAYGLAAAHRLDLGSSAALGSPRSTEASGILGGVRSDFLLSSAARTHVEAHARLDLSLFRRVRTLYLDLSGCGIWRAEDLPKGGGVGVALGVTL